MATRKTTERVTLRTLAAEVRANSEAVHANGVLLEQLQSQMLVVLEGLTSFRAELKSDVATLREELSARISILEEVVRKNSEEIRKNSADIRDLREEVARLRHDFEHRSDVERIGALERRVAAMEARLGVTS